MESGPSRGGVSGDRAGMGSYRGGWALNWAAGAAARCQPGGAPPHTHTHLEGLHDAQRAHRRVEHDLTVVVDAQDDL